MRTQLIIFLVSLAFAPVATTKRFQPWVCTAPAGPKSRQVEYQGIFSGSGFSPCRSETALCPANRPIGRACWHDITEVCPLSILAAAMSPAAYMSSRSLTFKNSSTGRRPQWSRSPGKRKSHYRSSPSLCSTLVELNASHHLVFPATDQDAFYLHLCNTFGRNASSAKVMMGGRPGEV